MSLSSKILRIPRPQSFLYLMSLQTGASLVTLSLLLNKVSGLYGLLALLTGVHLSPLQLSMYIYSIIALALTAFLAPHIRIESPLQCLALAWFYLLDSIINAAYTAAFGATWFLVISQHHNSAPTAGPGSSTIQDTAGFTNPKFNVSSVEVGADKQESVAQPASAPAGVAGDGSGSASLHDGMLLPGSIQSIAIICTLWTIRVYFVLIMLSFARQCLRQHAFYSKTSMPRYNTPGHSRNSSIVSNFDSDPNPFAPRKPEGQGWKGRLGRIMVAVGRSYWLEGDDDDASWMTGLNQRFRKNFESGNSSSSEGGPIERERRRRSGTGPPLPSQGVIQAASLQQHSRSSSAQSGMGLPIVEPGKMYELSEVRPS
ncbi:hypothetical protein AJ80_08412 [Polytolypa hystricis UAMH7299]|uniref:DUF1753-domain-containing protein n=1 Tax=Polytolypa hystricis (strain UAMH7299) TaxID=1447883 RepID=A0A2B7X8K9_POLH7|nr:hypothetical protein AJ80_08412 [Polytolypa hystricis UAMH7299]